MDIYIGYSHRRHSLHEGGLIVKYFLDLFCTCDFFSLMLRDILTGRWDETSGSNVGIGAVTPYLHGQQKS